MKNKYFFTITILIAASLILSACDMIPFINVTRGSGNVVTETREISSFNEITLNGAGRLIITQGTTESLEIQAEDNIVGELSSGVLNNELVLGFQDSLLRKTLFPTEIIVYTLTLTDLNKLTINGAADLSLQGLETSTLELTLNGAGQINVGGLTADSLVVKLLGTGAINISGQVSVQTVSIEGAGNYQAGDLQTNSTAIKISGLGNGTVWATNTLDITISGGGSVGYYGNPQVTQEITGVGDINNRGEK